MEMQQIAAIGIATLGGAAIGLERQSSGHATGPQRDFGGLRTFTLLGLLAGCCGWMWTAGFPVLAAVLTGGAAALIVAGYVVASRAHVDATTEVAALAVLAAGLVAGVGEMWLGGAVIALTALVLSEKSALHEMAERLDPVGLRAGFLFAAMAIVVLPLLPEGPYGPWGGVRPRLLWLLVLFFCGLNFVGYGAKLVAGPRKGYLVTGLLGGIVSSTNVTWQFSRLSRSNGELSPSLALGAIAANMLMYVRMIVATSVIHADVGKALAPYLIAPLLAGLGVMGVGIRRNANAAANSEKPTNPLNLKEALQLAALFQVVMFGVHLAEQQAGQWGVVTSAAILGLTSVDALIVSLSQNAQTGTPVETAALALAVGGLSNMALKFGVAVTIGRDPYRWMAGVGLAAMAAAAGLSILVIRFHMR